MIGNIREARFFFFSLQKAFLGLKVRNVRCSTLVLGRDLAQVLMPNPNFGFLHVVFKQVKETGPSPKAVK